jgi:hypothetical protein
MADDKDEHRASMGNWLFLIFNNILILNTISSKLDPTPTRSFHLVSDEVQQAPLIYWVHRALN